MKSQDMRSGISPDCIAEMLNSAPNAYKVGQAQYSTPETLARVLAGYLPQFREVICDLTAGSGQLLAGVMNDETKHVLAVEIQRMNNVKVDRPAYQPLNWRRITADVTLAYAYLVEAGFQCDLFALNPPFGLRWHKERLLKLLDCDLPHVKAAFKAHDPSIARGEIDSTAATMMMALSLMTERGEGVIVANHQTVDRLIFRKDAPYKLLANHVWAHFILDGNPITESGSEKWNDGMAMSLIYFAASHNLGPQLTEDGIQSVAELKRVMARGQRYKYRTGPQVVFSNNAWPETVPVFDAVKQEISELRKGQKRDDYNISVDADGIIKTYLSSFDEHSMEMVDKVQAQALHEINGRRPMELVMQSATRIALQNAVNGTLWRVDPKLPGLVADCIRDYNAVRSPLSPLMGAQKLGYLDETDFIVCKKTLYLEDLVDTSR